MSSTSPRSLASKRQTPSSSSCRPEHVLETSRLNRTDGPVVLTWVALSVDHEIAVNDGRLWVLTRDRMAGKRNRWNLIAVYDQGRKYKAFALECPPGQCKHIALTYEAP